MTHRQAAADLPAAIVRCVDLNKDGSMVTVDGTQMYP